jgi:hypothetical protein
MRFYKIVPKQEPWATSTKVHWLFGLSRQGNDAYFYPAACGKNVLGTADLAFDARVVTCEVCQTELIVQALKDSDMLEDLQPLSDALAVPWKDYDP